MPLSPEQWAKYPEGWQLLSWNIVVNRAEGRCECAGECAGDPKHLDDDVRCRNRHGQPRWRGQPWQRPVILSAAHLDHNPASKDLDMILVMCESCHLRYDSAHHAATRQARREQALGLLPLFDLVQSSSR